jgi:transposase
MAQVHVERLDHLGLLASVIKDLGLMDMMDSRLMPDEQERLTPGEAVAGMILNGLGFASRPLSLTPQFFAHKPLDLLFRPGIDAEMFNRFKLGRTLDDASAYGCDRLFQELALAICAQGGIDLRFNHLDTTSFALTGEYVPESDEHAIRIPHGYSKDHRPDLQQAVVELMVSQDGGVPFVSKSWDGNASDTQVFQQRAEALMRAFKDTPTPRYLVADAKLYCEDKAVQLAKLGFITRIPATLKLVSQGIGQALQWDTWQTFDEHTRYQPLALCHYGIAQPWLVVYSQAALERAEATLKKAQQREDEAIKKQLVHLQAQRFCAPEAAHDALSALAKRWKYHAIASAPLTEHKHYAGQGRPTPRTPLKASTWQIHGHVHVDDTTIEQAKHAQACYILRCCSNEAMESL